MITFYGLYENTIYRYEKSGYTCFTIKTNDIEIKKNSYGTVTCTGKIPAYSKNMPLVLTGDFITRNEKESFQVMEYTVKTKSEADIIALLSSDFLPGLGQKIAEKIAAVVKEDIFDFAKHENALEILSQIPKIESTLPAKIINRLNKISALGDLIKYIISMGGSYNNAIDLYDKYGVATEDMIKNNPYMMRYAGVPIEIIENVANKLGIESYDRRRTTAITDIVLTSNRKNGNSRISFDMLCERIWSLETKCKSKYHTDPLYIAESVVLLKCIDVEEDGIVYIYKKEDYNNEKIIAAELKRLHESAFEMDDRGISLESIMEECGIYYGASQSKAFDMLNTTGVKLLLGGPGTGKTTTINGILKKYSRMNPDKTIAMCAPTGCAAKKLISTTGRQALTIHKYLDIRPYEETFKSKDSYDQLDADCIVIDEMSMVDEQIFALLLRAVKNGTLLILVGDSAQLESVGTGSVLRDLIRSNTIETYYLDTVFRQKNGNKIIDNSIRIKEGNTNLITDDLFEIIHCKNEEEIIDELLKKLANNKDAKVITTSRNKKFLTGSVVLNSKIQNLLHSDNGEVVYCNGYRFSIGDKIIMNENNYEKGYFNGDEGQIIDIRTNGYRKEIVVSIDERVISLSGSSLDSLELNYAITAYKAQGNEYDSVIIILPKNPKGLLQKSLLYVAVTRARKKVLIIEEDGAFYTAVTNKYKKERNTGLYNKLIA